jgi:hypothetical protein
MAEDSEEKNSQLLGQSSKKSHEDLDAFEVGVQMMGVFASSTQDWKKNRICWTWWGIWRRDTSHLMNVSATNVTHLIRQIRAQVIIIRSPRTAILHLQGPLQ